ncbi:helix-turn-helix domain-containing protein [Hymenobacter baengnokdamensis]|uniref:helix-turn-helix domain-containing protein n=1 Tax=Hymenobacter baengnokdamensis TaxID=2615203 RepID=UPI0012455A7B|nr:hypothetical protein [Hymenobacter baengnokdamensis]
MPLSQKELEDFIWQQPRLCEARGLRLYRALFALGRRYQHLDLGPYGEAQQVSVRFDPPSKFFFVQFVLSSTGTIGSVTYFKAKRQLSALKQLLQQAIDDAGIEARICAECVLIGQDIQQTGDLVFVLNLDAYCQVFTYSCNATTGLRFEPVSKKWCRTPTKEQALALQELATDLLTEREDALAIAAASRAHALAACSTTLPVELAELMVTPLGVLAAPGATQLAPVGQLSLFATSALPTGPADTTIGQRLGQLSQHMGGGKVSRLARAAGLPAPVLHNLAADRHAPSFETLRQLLTALPQISPAWLVLGQGPMLASPSTH